MIFIKNDVNTCLNIKFLKINFILIKIIIILFYICKNIYNFDAYIDK